MRYSFSGPLTCGSFEFFHCFRYGRLFVRLLIMSFASPLSSPMEKQLTEETVGGNLEETLAKNPPIDIGITVQLMTFFLLTFGWVLPVEFRKENVNVRIPSYIWLSSAAFHVICIVIFINIAIVAFRCKEARTLALGSLFYLGLCLTSFISLFIWFCQDR